MTNQPDPLRPNFRRPSLCINCTNYRSDGPVLLTGRCRLISDAKRRTVDRAEVSVFDMCDAWEGRPNSSGVNKLHGVDAKPSERPPLTRRPGS